MAKAQNTKDAVTRISASSSSKSKKTKTTPAAAEKVKKTKVANQSPESPRKNPLSAFFGYFKGAWKELRQVRWPNRRATWSLTGAVLAFSAFFVVFILLLDALFKYIFEVILK